MGTNRAMLVAVIAVACASAEPVRLNVRRRGSPPPPPLTARARHPELEFRGLRSAEQAPRGPAPAPPQSPRVPARVLLSVPDPFQCHVCLEGTFCFQNILSRCPAHSVSQNRSDSVEDCLCKPGFFQNASFTAGGACLPCLADHFCAGGGGVEACHEHSLSPSGSYSRAQCLCAAGYSPASADSCAACAPGTHKPDTGGMACAPCAENTYAPAPATATCTTCPANTVSAAGESTLAACVPREGAYGAPGAAATLCAAGFYAPQRNASACTACPSDSYLPATGATSASDCLACPANSAVFADATSTLPNGVGAALAQCVCAPGFERAAGVCQACGAGAHKPAAGEHACTLCPPDTFVAPGSTACTACPEHSRSPAGSASALACACDAGYAGRTAGAPHAGGAIDECAACAAGSFKAQAGNVACEPCAPGFYELASASTACAECPADHFVRADGACVSCGAHERAPARSAGPAACTCAAGHARSALAAEGALLRDEPNGDGDGDGDPDCRPCAPGYFRGAAADDARCSACPAGHFSYAAANVAAEDCMPCGQASYVAATANGTFCRPCPPHSNSTELSVGVESCFCEAGRFRAGASWTPTATLEHVEALEAALACEPCARGTFKAAGDHAPCTVCAPGTSGVADGLRADASACAPCAPGTYSVLQYSHEARVEVPQCVACPAEAVSGAGSTSLANCSCDTGFAFVATGAACEPCAPGRYKLEVSNTLCRPCEAGSYALGAASLCTPCPPNSTTAAGGAVDSAACVCRAGYVLTSPVPVHAGGACALCAPGSFSESLGAATCEDCGALSFLAPGTPPGVRACVACPPRSRAKSRAHSVLDCIPLPGLLRAATNRTVRVELELALGVSPAAATAQRQRLRSAVAAAARAACSCAVALGDVIITNLVTYHARRLLSDGSLLEVAILVPSFADGELLVTSLSLQQISAQLADPALPLTAITAGPALVVEDDFFVACPLDSYCPDSSTIVPCPANSTAPMASSSESDCTCMPGLFGAAHNCSVCPPDFFCPGGTSAPLVCMQNSSTRGLVARTAVDDCECDAGTYRASAGAGAECVVCPADSFCFEEMQVLCPANSSAPRAAIRVEQCECHAGTIMQHAGAACDTEACAECLPCNSSIVCHTGRRVEHCAPNSSSANFACRCAQGMHCSAPQTTFGFGPSCSGGAAACLPCARGHYCDGIAQLACGPGEDALARSHSVAACRCKPGHHRIAPHECELCGIGFICPGGMPDALPPSAHGALLHQNETRMATTAFDPHLTTLAAGTTDISLAVCEPSYFRTARVDSCKLCPQNFWCLEEQHDSVLPNVVACLTNEVTEEPGMTSPDDCFCMAGFKSNPQDNTVACIKCSVGERCQAGNVVEAQCHAMNRVPNAEHSKCVCDVGYGEYVLQCQVCPTGSVKTAMGDFPCVFCGINEYAASASEPCRPCPSHSFSRPGATACTCYPPFVWRGAQCVLCEDDQYWASITAPVRHAQNIGLGAPPGVCLPCPTNSFGNASVHMPSGLVHCRCESGSAAVPRLPANMSFGNETAPAVNHLLACAPCAAGQFEASGVCLACPPNSSSAPGAAGAGACLCARAQAADACHRPRLDGSCAGMCADTPPACAACPPGAHKPAFSTPGNADACAPCARGTFQPAAGAAECEACPPLRTTVLPGASALTTCKCVGGWTQAEGVACAACLPGHFKELIGDEACSVCGQGRFQPFTNATACHACAAATESLGAFAEAVAREGGNATHAIHPVLEANSTHDETRVSVLECVCETGHEPRADGDAKRCEDCLVGSFKPQVGLQQCYFCGRQDIPDVGGHGIYRYGNASAPVTDFAHCIACPPFSGQDPAVVGAAALMDSIDKCKCFAGYEKRTPFGCSLCAAYMHQPAYSDADCEFCPAGFFFVGRQYACQLCDLRDEDDHSPHQGHVANSVNLSYAWAASEDDCVCRRGYERLAESFHTCSKCKPGFFHADAFAHTCTACAVDTYQELSAALACVACPLNSTTRNRTGTPALANCVCDPGFENLVGDTCVQCPAGKFRTHRAANVEDGVATACLECPAHAYCPLGSVEPTPCPLDEISAPGSASKPDCKCAAGRGRAHPEASCEFCAHAFFAPGNTNLPCEACPANKNTSAPGAASVTSCACTPGHGQEEAHDQPCAPCATGYFARGGSNTPCIHCGFGTVTEPASSAAGPEACQCDATLGLGLTTLR